MPRGLGVPRGQPLYIRYIHVPPLPPPLEQIETNFDAARRGSSLLLAQPQHSSKKEARSCSTRTWACPRHSSVSRAMAAATSAG